MCFSYKLRFKSTAALSKDIQDNAANLLTSRVKISRLNKKLDPFFEKLKKVNIELTKFCCGHNLVKFSFNKHKQSKQMLALLLFP